MNRIRFAALRSLLLLLLGVVLTPGCDTPLPVTPEPPASSIAGAWIGTVIAIYEFDEGSCVKPTTATFTQSGSAVLGTLTDSAECGGSNQYSFEGTLEGNLLKGRMIYASGSWRMSALVSGDHLAFANGNTTWDLHR